MSLCITSYFFRTLYTPLPLPLCYFLANPPPHLMTSIIYNFLKVTSAVLLIIWIASPQPSPVICHVILWRHKFTAPSKCIIITVYNLRVLFTTQLKLINLYWIYTLFSICSACQPHVSPMSTPCQRYLKEQ